jgi:hypothetical protein
MCNRSSSAPRTDVLRGVLGCEGTNSMLHRRNTRSAAHAPIPSHSSVVRRQPGAICQCGWHVLQALPPVPPPRADSTQAMAGAMRRGRPGTGASGYVQLPAAWLSAPGAVLPGSSWTAGGRRPCGPAHTRKVVSALSWEHSRQGFWVNLAWPMISRTLVTSCLQDGGGGQEGHVSVAGLRRCVAGLGSSTVVSAGECRCTAIQSMGRAPWRCNLAIHHLLASTK